MKRMCLSFVFALLAISLFGQITVDQYINKWVDAYNKSVRIYNDSPCEKGGQEALIREAYDSLSVSVTYLEKVVALNSQYREEANIRLTQSTILFSLFHSRPCARTFFTTERAVTWMKTFESRWPVVKRIVISELQLKKSTFKQVNLDQLLYDGYWECFSTYYEAKDTAAMSNTMHRYIELLRKKYTNTRTFCNAVFSDTTMTMEVARLKKMLETVNYTHWGTHEMDYRILKLEISAEEKARKPVLSKDDMMASLEKMLFLQEMMLIELEMELDKPAYVLDHYDELTRLKQATGTLELNYAYQNIYTALVASSRATDQERWEYLEAMNKLGQTITLDNEDLNDSIYSNMCDVCDCLYATFHVEDSFEEPFKRLQVYYDAAGDKDGVKKCLDGLAAIERARLKRERTETFERNWGLSVGFAPIKTLFFGGKQASYFADLTTFGLTHGVRYCKFDGFTDNYRFYSWLINDDKPGGSFTYSGYEASYWIALFSTRDEFVQQRVCLEYRYGNYAFEPLANATLLNRSTGEAALTGITVNPVGINKDVTLVYRLQLFAGRRFFFEGNVGLGLGYRTLRADQDLKTYEIDNDSFNDVRWNRITLPGRLGLRCGIKLF